MRVCVIGGGVAGVQVAQALCDEHDVHVFEKSDALGGVWRENYCGYALQVPAELYEFVDFPCEDPKRFSDGDEVRRYIDEYVRSTELFLKATIHLEEEVTRVRQGSVTEWIVSTPGKDGSVKEYAFDYCVVATGMYHLPHVPASLRDLDHVVHSSRFVDASVASGKRVSVVGGGKSAIDCAVAAAAHAERTTLITRELHWPVPRFILGCIPFKWGTYSRLGHFLLPKHWCVTEREAWWHDRLRPIKRCVWSLLERVFAIQFGMDRTPVSPLDVDLFNGGQILTYEFRNAVASGKIRHVISSDLAQARTDDLIVCGTGFTKSYDIFEADVLARLDRQTDGLWLYKNIVPAKVNGLAFVGSEVSTFNNILTQHLQAQWLKHHICGDNLCSAEQMEEYVQTERRWKRSWMADTPSRASLVQLHMIKYHDTLQTDMDRPCVKTAWWQWILPHDARDYTRV